MQEQSTLQFSQDSGVSRLTSCSEIARGGLDDGVDLSILESQLEDICAGIFLFFRIPGCLRKMAVTTA